MRYIRMRDLQRKTYTPANMAAAEKLLHCRKWERVRLKKLRLNPICEWEGCNQAADSVHHIQSRLQRPDLAYDLDNLCSYCKKHHELKEGKGNK